MSNKNKPVAGINNKNTPTVGGQNQSKPTSAENTGLIQENFAFQYTGPIPPASELEHYSHIDESLPERIVTMAENEQKQQHKIADEALAQNKKKDENNFKLANRGMWLAFVFGFIDLGVVIYLSIIDQGIVASVLAGSTLVGVMALLITRNSINIFKDKNDKSDK